MSDTWGIRATCGLCSAKTPTFHDVAASVADAQADAAALALGWVLLVPVQTAGRARPRRWICKGCAGDVTAACLMAGRAKQTLV